MNWLKLFLSFNFCVFIVTVESESDSESESGNDVEDLSTDSTPSNSQSPVSIKSVTHDSAVLENPDPSTNNAPAAENYGMQHFISICIFVLLFSNGNQIVAQISTYKDTLCGFLNITCHLVS